MKLLIGTKELELEKLKEGQTDLTVGRISGNTSLAFFLKLINTVRVVYVCKHRNKNIMQGVLIAHNDFFICQLMEEVGDMNGIP